MRPVALSDEIAVGEMPTLDQVAILAKAGFRSLLNAQPDGEVARLVSSANAAEAAKAVEMAYAHVPLGSRRLTEPEIAAFAAALATLPKPIYACCYSGSRAAAGWAIAVASALPFSEIARACTSAGYDIDGIENEVMRRRPAAPEASPPAPGPTPAISEVTTAADPKATSAPLLSPAVSATLEPPAMLASEATAEGLQFYPRAAADGGFVVSG
jgi:uncharacterized protein (TIGR01244 family)